MKKVLLIVAVVVIIGGSIFWWISKKEKENVESMEEELPPLEVKGAIVERGDVIEWVEALGTIESSKKMEFISPVNTTVEWVFVQEGERVKRGTSLIKLQCGAEKAGFEKAKYELEKARSKYEFALKKRGTDTTLLRITTGLTDAERKFLEAKRILKQLDIKAPFDGVVADLNLEKGSGIKQGDKILLIYSDKDLVSIVEVPQVEMEGINTGVKAIVHSVNKERQEEGVVRSVSPVIGEKRTGKIKVSLKGKWMMGEVVEVEIEKRRYKARVRVPVEAVLHREERYLVFAVKEGYAKWQWIKKGKEGRDYVEVLEGVVPDDTVLVEGQFTIAHDAPVKVIME